MGSRVEVAPDAGRGGDDHLGSPGAGSTGRFQEPGAAISEDTARARARAGQDARERCLALLADVGTSYLMFSPVARRIVYEEGVLVSTSPSLVAVVAVKSTATLVRRTCSIRLYRAWFVTSGFERATFFTERGAYGDYKFLHDERAPATRAAGMHQAFLFLGGGRDPSRGLHAELAPEGPHGHEPQDAGGNPPERTAEGGHGHRS